ncbi:MAG: helix-turn-helix transcriptional regulator [Phycisphaerales bacterium]
MSIRRQPALRPVDERFLIVRSLVARCAPGLRTSSPSQGWHRLIAASSGVMIVRTPRAAWSCPARNAVWTPAGVRADLETCGETTLRVLHIRTTLEPDLPDSPRVVDVSTLLRATIERIAMLPGLDRRIGWHAALARLLLHEIRAGAATPSELLWPSDSRAMRIAAILQTAPGDRRRLSVLCRGQGVSARTTQRLFPLQTGLTFEAWRQRLRLLHATRLLAEDRKIADVARACGYRSPSAFIAAFRRHRGSTPGAYAGIDARQ